MKSESAPRASASVHSAIGREPATGDGHLENVAIDIEPGDRASVVALLNRLLADEYILYTETRKYHWNVTGPNFHDLHKFFEAQYEELNEVVDDVAERIRALGGWPAATLTEFSRSARLRERTEARLTAEQMIGNLLSGHEGLIRQLRHDSEACVGLHDMGTNDFLVGRMEQHEKMAWMLRSSLESRP